MRNLGYKEISKPQKKVIEVKDNLNSNFNDDTKYIPNRPQKKFLSVEYEQKIHRPQTKSIKMVDARGKKDNMNDIFLGRGKDEEYRFTRKQFKNPGIPSYETVKRNNENFLSNPNKKIEKNTYRSEIYKKNNTDHLFNQGNDNDYYNIEKTHKKIFHLNSNMGQILSHDNVPRGYDIYSSKPNEVNYKTLVSSLPGNFENIKKYGKKVY